MCLVFPPLIPWLITIDPENVNNDNNSDAARGSDDEPPPMAVETMLYRFYTAPIVKFCCHAVTN